MEKSGILVASRSDLLRHGEELEKSTFGRWLADAVVAQSSGSGWIVDSARTDRQVHGLRQLSEKAFHVHVTAISEERKRRFEELRGRDDREDLSFARLSEHPLERRSLKLEKAGDVVIDTTWLDTKGALLLVLRRLSEEAAKED